MKSVLLGALALLLGTAAAAAQTKLALGTPPIAEVEAAFVAKDQGYFDKNGLSVDFLPTGSNQTLVTAVVAGSHQIVAVSPTVLLQALESGLDLVVVANCGVTAKRTANNVGLAVRENVSVASPADLKGKKIGVPSIGGTLDVLFRQWLKQNGLTAKAVSLIEVPIPNTADVLKGGTIDAIIAGQPSLGRAVSLSRGSVAFHFMRDLPENLPYTTFVATRAWAEKNGETVGRFRAAMAEGARFVSADPARTREIVAKYTKLPIEVLSAIELPECRTAPSPDTFAYLGQVMQDEGMLRAKVDAARVVLP